MKVTLELELPKGIVLTEYDAKMMIASTLFDRGDLSSGQAAEIVGIGRREFLETAGKYGVSIFQYSAEELKEDLARLRKEV